MTDSVVLLGGGIDSAVCLAVACEQEERVLPIHINYGQQNSQIECAYANIQRHHLADQYQSTDVEDVRTLKYDHIFNHFTDESGRTPMMNIHFISSAAAIADKEDAENIYLGLRKDEDDRPDFRREFLYAVTNATNYSLTEKEQMTLVTPVFGKGKGEVVEMGDRLGIDFSATYSCEQEPFTISNPDPCNDCPPCKERAAAFAVSDVDDPYDIRNR